LVVSAILNFGKSRLVRKIVKKPGFFTWDIDSIPKNREFSGCLPYPNWKNRVSAKLQCYYNQENNSCGKGETYYSESGTRWLLNTSVAQMDRR
jgi:hypothetical protein